MDLDFCNILIGGLMGWGVDLGTNCVSKPSKKVYYIEGTPKAPKAPKPLLLQWLRSQLDITFQSCQKSKSLLIPMSDMVKPQL